MTGLILDVRDLRKSFGGIHVTQGVTLDLKHGEKSAIIGPNGAGKSTFFNLLTGYYTADAGAIVYNGSDITSWSPHRIVKAGVSRAFQVSNVFTGMSVWENVRTAVHAHAGKTLHLLRSAATLGSDRTAEVLTLCGLLDRSAVNAGELSQGDKKKLELAIAVAGQPKLLLLDEPTAGMSVRETGETMDLVDRLNEELKVSVLFTEHDMGVVFNHAERISLLHRGQFLVTGSPETIRADETVRKVYLGEEV
ncbi:ABC transporter ATP-binding protein [Roseibium sp. M-1]